MKFSLITMSALLLFTSPAITSAKIIKKNEIKKTFDEDHGWWWYEEEVLDENETKTTIKYKISPEAKREIESQKETQKLLQLLIKQQIISNQLNKDIKDRLDYAFPDTVPKYTTNKKTGKKCLTNSSKDCFVMPIIAEGQQVPALKAFLRNPSPENSKNWLQWQGTYFNHVSNVSHGLRFAFLKDGAEAYPTETAYAYGDNLFNPRALDLKTKRERDTLKSMKEEIAYLIFIGESLAFEKSTDIFVDLETLSRGYMKDMNKALIFSSKESYNRMERYANNVLKNDKTKQSLYNGWSKIKKSIRPNLFKTYNIVMTPAAVAYIKTKEMKKPLFQTISVGNITRNKIRENTIEFLKYSGILKGADFSADKNWNSLEKDSKMLKKQVELPKRELPKNHKNGDGEEYEKDK